MSTLINRRCAQCGREFEYGEQVLPIYRITHRGSFHTEVDPALSDTDGSVLMTHLRCPVF